VNVIPFVHEGLGNSSYLVELTRGRALLVDPDRSVDRYLRAAEDRGLDIVAVAETHLHADFVSGAHEMGTRTDARVFVPPDAEASFPHVTIAADATLAVEGVAIDVVASPGHTPEHVSYVARPPQGPPMLFSGGSLIVGGAARTDLIAPERTAELTHLQFQTLRGAFTELPDEAPLYPTHGGGSFCSAGGSGERTSTLGRERADNPALAIADEEEFSSWFLSTFPAVPAYFARMRAINQAGARLRSEIAVPPPLAPAEFAAARDRGALVVDLRPVEAYMREHIPGALSNPFRDDYATWLGWLVELETELLFVRGDEPLERVLDESLLVGFERFGGWLDGGMARWAAEGLPVATAGQIDAATAERHMIDGAAVIDVREPDEFAMGHVEGAANVPLGSLAERVDEVPDDRPVVVYCAHGMRGASGVSLLERAGRGPLYNLDGGVEAWRKAGLPAGA
jgi:rhodanese-related sulfurtransferase